MTTQPAATDTSDMFPVHQVFRKALGDAPALFQSTTDDPARAALVANFYDNVLAFLDAHHDGEDALVFPLLVERCPGDRARIEEIAGQHQGVHGLLETAKGSVAAFAGAPDDGTRQAAATALTDLDGTLGTHLDVEEEEIVPLASVHMSPEEWGALPGHGMAHFTGDKIWLILGLIRENMTDEQRAAMLAHMPPPAVDMWQNMGNAAFDQMIAEVRQAG